MTEEDDVNKELEYDDCLQGWHRLIKVLYIHRAVTSVNA